MPAMAQAAPNVAADATREAVAQAERACTDPNEVAVRLRPR